jgi:hypothetical protein
MVFNLAQPRFNWAVLIWFTRRKQRGRSGEGVEASARIKPCSSTAAPSIPPLCSSPTTMSLLLGHFASSRVGLFSLDLGESVPMEGGGRPGGVEEGKNRKPAALSGEGGVR